MRKQTPVVLADGNSVTQVGSVMSKWVDDFGGTALDVTLWDVYDGGTYVGSTTNSKVNGQLLTNVNGSGVTGITYALANSVMTVTIPTTSNAEMWFVSKAMFTSPIDLYVSMKLSQRIVNNTMYFEFVECDPESGDLVPHATVVGETRNRGGIALLSSAGAQTVNIEATCDDSGVSNTIQSTTMVTVTADEDYLLEVRPQDLVLGAVASDAIAARSSGGIRLSRQVPDPNKTYRLRMRFKNVGAPATSTTVTMYRIMVADVQELTMEVTSGRGDTVAGKGLPVNIASALPTGSNSLGTVVLGQSLASTVGNVQDIPVSQLIVPPAFITKVVSAAATYSSLLVAGSIKRVVNGTLYNVGPGVAYVKFFNKATAPTLGTDTPTHTFAIPVGGSFNVREHWGSGGIYSGALGIGIGITGAVGDLDTTALAANQIIGTIAAI